MVQGRNAEVQNSECECPAGKGPNATCKHIGAVLLMLQKFVDTGRLLIDKSCTEGLQTFHKPRKPHTGMFIAMINGKDRLLIIQKPRF